MRTSSPPRVLLVEDNPGDARLTAEALRDNDGAELHVVEDGEKALAFLRREAPYAGRGRLDLVLLDLNVPRVDGLDVLSEMRSADELSSLPVVVFTSSAAEHDVDRCYELKANAFVTKPIEMAEFMSTVGAIRDFWLHTARLPRGDAQRERSV